MLTSLHLHMKSRRVCIKTRSPPASLPLKGQVTRHTTEKWPIVIDVILLPYISMLQLLSGNDLDIKGSVAQNSQSEAVNKKIPVGVAVSVLSFLSRDHTK